MKVKTLDKGTMNGEDFAKGAELDVRPAAARALVDAGQAKYVDKADESPGVVIPNGGKKK